MVLKSRYLKMLLLISVLFTVVFSFPTQQENRTEFMKNASNIFGSTENRKPLVILVEETNPKSGSMVVEFVYNGNSISDSKVSNKEKYQIIPQTHKDTIKETVKPSQIPNIKQKNDVQPTKPNTAFKTDDNFEMMKVSSLISEEVSPLLENWPKYFFDVFNPIRPFPELQHQSLNKIHPKTIHSSISDADLPFEKKQKKLPETSGPQLNPLSIYDREFRQPIFD